MAENKPDEQRRSIGLVFIIIIGLVIGLFLRRVPLGLIIGILLGLSAVGLRKR